MKYLYIISVLFLGVACSDGSSEKINDGTSEGNDEVQETLEHKMVRHIEGNLAILGTEKYSYEVFSEHLDGDDSIDYVITVNRLENALDNAIKSGNTAQRAEMGYIGKYNFIFYMDGATKDITPAIPVASSPHAELDVTFAHIRSEAYKDIMVDFRVRNSCFRRFFTVVNEIPLQTFEAKIFDYLGEENAEAYSIKFEPGSYSLAKDIYVYKADIENVTIKSMNDVYDIYPKITPTDQLDRKWFFNDHMQKYFTEK